MEFNEKDVKLTYSVLGHRHQTEIRVIGSGKAIQEFVQGEREFIQVIEKWNGEKQIYVGINERKKNGSSARDVKYLALTVLDIDPNREKNSNSNPVELARAILRTNSIQKYLKSNGIISFRAMSGNGCQLWIPFEPIEVTDQNRNLLNDKIQNFQSHVIDKFSYQKVKVDQIGDLARIIKVIGSVAVKAPHTKERPQRLSKWIDKPKKIPNPGFWDFVNKIKLSKNIKVSPSPIEKIPCTSDEVFKIPDKKLQYLLKGNCENYKSRSEAEMALVCKLIYWNYTKEQVFELMENKSQIGKWKEKPISYKNLTYEKAEQLQKERFDPSVPRINLTHGISHLREFESLKNSVGLYGEDYNSALIALYYQLIGSIISQKKIGFGKIKLDTRIHVSFPIESDWGKSNIISATRDIHHHITGTRVEEIVSLHPEQLIGTLIPVKEKGRVVGWEENRGYLDADIVIKDEAVEFMTSSDPQMRLARNYVRIAKDVMGNNPITKRLTKTKAEESLSYYPSMVFQSYFQPIRLPMDLLIKGDLKRDIIPYTWLDINPEKILNDRLYAVESRDQESQKFAGFLGTIKNTTNDQWKFSADAKEAIQECCGIMRLYVSCLGEKAIAFGNRIPNTLFNHLIKWSAIYAASQQSQSVAREHVYIAFLDLLQVLECHFAFVTHFVDVKTGKYGGIALGRENEVLEVLQQKGEMTISDFQKGIQEIFSGIKEREARNIMSRLKQNGLIGTEIIYGPGKDRSSRVWLKINPKKYGGNPGNSGSRNQRYRLVVRFVEGIKKKLPDLVKITENKNYPLATTATITTIEGERK